MTDRVLPSELVIAAETHLLVWVPAHRSENRPYRFAHVLESCVCQRQSQVRSVHAVLVRLFNRTPN
jgi:hypothetical protein